MCGRAHAAYDTGKGAGHDERHREGQNGRSGRLHTPAQASVGLELLDFGVGSSWLRWHPQGPESNSGRDGLRYKHVVLVDESSNVSGPPPPLPPRTPTQRHPQDHQPMMTVLLDTNATSTSDFHKITKIPRLHCKLPPHPLTCFVTPCIMMMYYMHRRSERRGDCSVLGIRTR